MLSNPKLNNKVITMYAIKSIIAILGAILFVIYSPQFETSLPDCFRILFDNGIIKFAIILFIVYLGNNSLELSLLVSLIIILITSHIHKYDIKDYLTSKIQSDFFTNNIISQHLSAGKETFLGDQPPPPSTWSHTSVSATDIEPLIGNNDDDDESHEDKSHNVVHQDDDSHNDNNDDDSHNDNNDDDSHNDNNDDDSHNDNNDDDKKNGYVSAPEPFQNYVLNNINNLNSIQNNINKVIETYQKIY